MVESELALSTVLRGRFALILLLAQKPRRNLFTALGLYVAVSVALFFGLTHLVADRADGYEGGLSGAVFMMQFVAVTTLAPHALELARERSGDTEFASVAVLSRTRFITSRELQACLCAASVGSMVRALLTPLLVIGAFALTDVRSPLSFVKTVFSLGFLSVGLAFPVAVIAMACRIGFYRHGRTALLGVVLAPWMLSAFFPAIPSIPSVLGSMIAHVARWASG